MVKKSIKAISLFCGCGGSDQGLIGGFEYLERKYTATGIRIVHASDIDTKAVNTYNLNFKDKAVVEDVNNLRFKKGEADIVVGGFPCQAFSTVNPTKVPDHVDNQLFWQMAKVVEQVKPKAFVAENVKGFFRLEDGKYFKLAKEAFERLGYNISHSLINASDFGVPQYRERLFIVGVKRTLKKSFKFPEPTHGPQSRTKQPKVPLKAVIDSLIPENPKYYFSKRAVEGVKKAKPNMKRALAQDMNKPCLTITRHLAKVSINSRDPILMVDKDKELFRRFTPREAARIQSLPDEFKFSGSESDAYRQIGNAIAPVVMWHVVNTLKKQIF